MQEFQKYPHPLTTPSPSLYNIVNGRIAPPHINVNEAVTIGEDMQMEFMTSLPSGFHNPIKRKIKTMEEMTRGMKINNKTVYDLEAVFSRLLVVGQQRNMNLKDEFQCELCPVPPSLVD